MASAIWPTTSPPRSRARAARQDAAAALPQRLGRGCAGSSAAPGSAPKRTVVTSDSTAAKATTRAVDAAPRRGAARPAAGRREEPVHERAREQDEARGAAEEREEQALREQLADEAAAAGAERGPQRELRSRGRRCGRGAGSRRSRTPRAAPGRRRRGGRGAPGATPRPSRRAAGCTVPPDTLVRRRGTPARAASAIVATSSRALATVTPVAQAADHGQVPGAAAVRAEALVVLDRRPDLGALGIAEARRGDAHDRARLAVRAGSCGRRRRGRRRSGRARARGRAPPRACVPARSRPATKPRPRRGRTPQHVEEGGAHLGALETRRGALAREGDAVRVDRGEAGERGRLGLDVEEVLRRVDGRPALPGLRHVARAGRAPGTAAAAAGPRSRR